MTPSTLVKVISKILSNPKSIGKVLLDPDELEWRTRVSQMYGLDRGLPTVDLLDLVPRFDETIAPYCYMNGSSRTVDLALIKALARRFPDCRYLEIGTLRGESLANVAEVARECVSVSLSDEEILERGWGEEFRKNNGLFLGNVPNVTRIGHDSRTFDFSTVGAFDLVFVDGDHSYEGVLSDTRSAFSVLRNERSIVLWHDYGFEYETTRWSVMAGILDGAPAAARGRIYHVSNTLCAIYVNEALPTSFAVHPVIPNKTFSVRVSAEPLGAGTGPAM